MRPTSDGTVTLASQLRPEAQAEARLVMGFDEDHVGILSAPSVIEQVHRALATRGDLQLREEGRVIPRLSLSDPTISPAGTVIALSMTPRDRHLDQERGAVLLPLSYADGERTLGPFPAGTYEVCVVVPAFRAQPVFQQVILRPGEAVPVEFVLRPQGVLMGYVGTPGDSLVQPAGSFRRPDQSVRIQSLELVGPGVRRSIRPRESGPLDTVSAYLEGKDDAVGAHFTFVDLPEGDYTLTLVAEGFEPHVSKHRVVPGVVMPMSPVVLRRSG